MKENGKDEKIAKLQNDMKWVISGLKEVKQEVKEGFDAMTAELKKIYEGYQSVRHDVNLANSRTITNEERMNKLDQKYNSRFKDQSIRIKKLEDIVSKYDTIIKFVGGIAGFVGISNIVAVLVFLAKAS